MIGSHRLVTALGPGGIGKTRVAYAAADAVAADFDETVRVELAELADPALIGHVVAGKFGLPTTTEVFDAGPLAGLIGDRALLLLLDNCEHLISAAAGLVMQLTAACSNLHVLATSREVLGVPGEFTYLVPPLVADEAQALFADRAACSGGKDRAGAAPDPSIRELCLLLDHIPLAIELSASHANEFSPTILLGLIRSRMLKLEARGSIARSTSLDSCIDWSYQLCSPLEQRVWTGLAVFAGAFSLEAALNLLKDDFAEPEVLQGLAGLINKSVLSCDPGEGRTPYRMLEVLRQFGTDRALESDEVDLWRVRHRDHYLALALEFEESWIGGRQLEWMMRFKAEHANIRAAIEFSVQRPDEAPQALKMARILQLYFLAYGSGGEALRWIQLAVSHSTGTNAERAFALCVGSFIGSVMQQLDTANGLYEELSRLADEAQEDWVESYRLYAGSAVATFSGDADRGAELAAQGIELFTRLGDVNSLVHLQFLLGLSLSFAGRRDEASAAYRACFALTDPRGEDFFRTYALWSMGLDELFAGRPEQALALEREALGIKQPFNDQLCIALTLEALGLIAARSAIVGDNAGRAAFLLGSSDRIFSDIGIHSEAVPYTSQWRQEGVQAARAALTPGQFDAFFRLGRAAAQNDTIAVALGEDPLPLLGGIAALSPREAEIAALMAASATNREIADQLFLSVRTVESHVERILRKLEVTSRWAVAGALDSSR
ncbi:ATP-binding protein [Nocardioides baekrokdamisoli]|uniref:ATP-binding protein n=1 Tax=Nocardioides baekrokdamisoli TaxID=1804624 RepID=UPI000F797712|nr:LuxR C-terminal-related transcriptional regulator [Nocardioides baekrokdamisoli]